MTKRPVLAAALALALLPTAALAEECVPQGDRPEVDAALPNGDRYYAIARWFPLEGITSIWIYQESNGLDGLQRNDDHVGDLSCGNPDKIVL